MSLGKTHLCYHKQNYRYSYDCPRDVFLVPEERAEKEDSINYPLFFDHNLITFFQQVTSFSSHKHDELAPPPPPTTMRNEFSKIQLPHCKILIQKNKLFLPVLVILVPCSIRWIFFHHMTHELQNIPQMATLCNQEPNISATHSVPPEHLVSGQTKKK